MYKTLLLLKNRTFCPENVDRTFVSNKESVDDSGPEQQCSFASAIEHGAHCKLLELKRIKAKNDNP